MFQVITRSTPVIRLLAPRGAVLVEAVRGRKTRNDPKAKSKEGRIKTPPPVDPVEMVVLRERFTEYDLIMRALRLEFKEEMLRKRYEEEVGSLAEERAKQEAEEHRSLMTWNQEENLRMLKIRELRVQKEVEVAEVKKTEAAILREQTMEIFVKEKGEEIMRIQGRKILISTALVIVVTSCIPNMTRNLSRSVDMIKCSSHSTAERILASTSQVSSALHDMKDFVETIPDIVNSNRFLKIEQNVNVEEMKRGIRNASARLKAEFKAMQDTLEVTGHVTQKVIASSFIVLLLGSSVSYLVRYLTDLKHDNVCQTGRLQELLRARGVEELPEAYRKRLVRTRGWRMTQIELRQCLWGGTILGFYCLVCALVLGLDHLIYYVLQTSLSWTQDIPEVNTIISLRLKITIVIIGLVREPVGEMNKDYRYGILLLPPDCVRPLSPPDPSVLSTTAALFLTALVMILGEVFSRRIRRKICSSFYRDREEERALYLRDKILLKLEDEGNISSIGKLDGGTDHTPQEQDSTAGQRGLKKNKILLQAKDD